VIWFISDEHYNHRRIIEYAKRPFAFVEAMNRYMVHRMMSMIRPNDFVWHLGDFGFGPVNELKERLSWFPGRHGLVRGSHDRGREAMEDIGFCPVVEQAVVRFDGVNVLLSHRPLEFLPEGVTGVFHGHVHRADPHDLHEAGEPTYIQPFNLNLCVEMTDYQPVSYNTALKMLRKQLRRSKSDG